jgi:hypothetical protein
MLSRDNKPEPNSANPDFNEIFKAALAGDKDELQHSLKTRSIDVVDDYGRSAVLAVTMHNNISALQTLIKLGADVDFYDPALSSSVIDPTAFLYAGAHGLNTALEHLIKAGAKPHIFNYYGGTALIPAAEKGHIETVKLLLEKSNVDVNHVNRLGWTALMEAVVLTDGGPTHQQIIKLLLNHGADPDIADKNGVSALEHAKNRGFSEISELLKAV